MLARALTLLMWALVAGSALFWGFKIFAAPLPLPAKARMVDTGAAIRADLSRLLGPDAVQAVATATPAAAAPSRYKLLGVVAPKSPAAAREGVALIAVDDQPAKAYRIGAVVDAPQLLQSVSARGATLGPREGGTPITLALAPPSAETAAAQAPGSPMALRAAAARRLPSVAPKGVGPRLPAMPPPPAAERTGGDPPTE